MDGSHHHALEARLLSIPVRAGLAASHDQSPAQARELTVIRVVDDDGAVGWGECSALTTASYWPETARSSFEALASAADSSSDDPAQPLGPMARAAVEHALLDLRLRHEGRSLADHLGVTASSVTAGFVVGLGPIDDVVAQIGHLVDEGAQRVKLKIQPGHDRDVVRAVHAQWPDLELHVDANGSYRSADLPAVLALMDAGVSVFEQPFAWEGGATAGAARLVAAGASVLADEAVNSQASLDYYDAAKALTGLVVKPSRLGGLADTLSILDTLAERGLDAAAGGMLESGLGRHLLAALAGRPEFTVIGDVSPARRWLAADPWPDIALVAGAVEVPTGPGVAPLPDQELLDELTIERTALGSLN